jgi:threonine dehydratase
VKPSEVAAAADEAAARLAGVVTRTPLQRNDRLSAATGADVWLKREDLQVGRSYKVRGAYNLISTLPDAARAAGVVCASAGNHAQGVAYACAALGVQGRIYVPRTTPRQKRDRIVALGGEAVELVVLGDTYDEAAAAAAADTSRTPVPAFDDARTVAGQATIAAEILAELTPDVVVVPVGGGGLSAGVASYLAARHPSVQVIGVEPAGAPSAGAALAAGHPVTLAEIDGFVDGAAVRTVGTLTYALLAAAGVPVHPVAEGRICTEMLDLYQVDGIVSEPAGALATAALPQLEVSGTVVCLLSGGNNDVSRYGEVVERSLVFEGRKHYFLVDFPQEPGALRRFLDEVLGPDDDITRFEYVKKNNRETGTALVGLEIPGRDELPGLLDRMAAAGLHVERLEPGSAGYAFLV